MRSRILRVLLALLGLAVVAAAAIGGLMLTARPVPAHAFFTRFERAPLVMAHADDTGDGLWPGNTMVFLEGAAGLDVDVLEMDVHMTRDGVLVLMHDETVDRTTSGTGRIRDLTLAELQSLEVAGNWTQDAGRTYPYRGKGLRVPTLEQVFQRFPGYPMNIEIKQPSPSLVAPLCRLIREHGKQDEVLVASFHDAAIDELRETCPQLATSAGPGDAKRFVAFRAMRLTGAISPAYHAFQLPVAYGDITVITPGLVAAAHERRVQVHAWTINDPEQMQHLIDMGVDGILTDRPDILLGLLGRGSAQRR